MHLFWPHLHRWRYLVYAHMASTLGHFYPQFQFANLLYSLYWATLMIKGSSQMSVSVFKWRFGRRFLFQQEDRHLFNGLFSRTTWVSRHQKGLTHLHFNEARDDGVAVASAVCTMEIICISLQTGNHASTSPLNFLKGHMLFLILSQQC